MPSPDRLHQLEQLQSEIESFVRSLAHPIVVENEIELFDLTAAEWRLKIGFGKLLFEAWNTARSIARRVEDIAYRDHVRMGIFVRKPGGRDVGTLELRELRQDDRTGRAAIGRTRFRQVFLAMLAREFPTWRFERVSNRSDREHSFSAWYTRGVARQGTTAWAFLGLDDEETPGAADAVLASALIWLDWLRGHSDRAVFSGLKLFLPRAALDLTAHRAAHLDQRAARIELFQWQPAQDRPSSIDLRDFGNVETRLVPRRQSEMLVERHRELIHHMLGESFDQVDLLPDSSGTFLSARVLGLEVARVEGLLAPKMFFGLEGKYQQLGPGQQDEFRAFVGQVIELRRARSQGPSHEFYRMQAERWLERLVADDITKIDPDLLPDFVYPQVPAFSGGDRGVIDILAVTRAGRLTVIELKLYEEINLPFQGLDYWLRVKWLHERGQFQAFGYFPELGVASETPRLILVAPAFRFHSTTDRLVRYLDPSIEVVQVGLNDRWREKIKILFRREMRA